MNRQAVIFDKIANSRTFLGLGTVDFLEELRTDKSEAAQQVKMAKALKRRVILLIDSNLSPEQKDELRGFFLGFKTVREVAFDPKHKDWGDLRVALEEMTD